MKTNPWPLGIVLVFAIFAAGMAAAIGIAVTHRDSMVSENYYEQELKFQGRIDGQARALAAGATVAYDAAAGTVTVRLPAAQATKPAGKIEFYRPANPGLDCAFGLVPGADGVQTLDVSKLAAGSWTVRVDWAAGGQGYFLEQKISVLPK